MTPLRTTLFRRLLNALDAVELTARDLAAGAGVLLALLLIGNATSWAWVIIAIAGAGIAIMVSERLRTWGTLQSRDQSREVEQDEISGAIETALNAAISGLFDAAIILDGGQQVIGSNDAARQLFAVTPGRHIAQMTRAPELLQAVDAARERAEAHDFQLQLPPPLDRTFAVRVTPLGKHDRPNRPAVLVLLRDMTEQEQLSRMRADFVANASHELRTPLASLKGFIETLQGAAKDDALARENFLGIMQEQASRMSRLIDDLLSLSRIEMWEHVAPTAIVDVSEVVDDVMSALMPMANRAGIDLISLVVERPGRVIGDRDEVTQVVQNLVQNAIKYGRKGGKVEIALARDGQSYALSVRDDGIGIEPHHLPRLTERFYRVSAKDSRERGGTGLGLAIVKHILTRHRGQLRIASVPGQGSTFTVVLPAKVGA